MTLKRFLCYMLVVFFCFGLIVTLATPAFAGQSTQADMPTEKVVVPAGKPNSAEASAGFGAASAYRSVGGETTLIKVFPYYGATIVYLQCGHVVAKVVPAGCGYSAGKWRYTTDCQKSTPIYVSLPCMRHKP
ncbi:MAG: hypothetical protein A2W35_21110 [Chloroflexi bacterium RBG_16_57_11]|nr:MAG: hypothetical protein A2W35_21110 [Chloroflexi bacterium RBG_16_57_11]